MKIFVCALLILFALLASFASCKPVDSINPAESSELTAAGEVSSLEDPVKSEYDPATFMYYTLNDDGASYTAWPQGVPDVLEELVIPGEYKGLPVTRVAGGLDEQHVETIRISEGIREIDASFDDGFDIKHIYIPSSVVSIWEGAFNGPPTMGHRPAFVKSNVIETIVVAEGNPYYYADGNCLIERSSQKIILGCNNSVIPTDGSVKIIGKAAFANCKTLEEVVLPASILELEYAAFDNCESLKKVYITSSTLLDKAVINFDSEFVFGYDANRHFYVPDAETRELYTKLFGPYTRFELGIPYDRILSVEEVQELALDYWRIHDYWRHDSCLEDPGNELLFSVDAVLFSHAYRVELTYFDEDCVSTLDQIVIDAYTGDVVHSVAIPLISREEAAELAVAHWKLPSVREGESFRMPVLVESSFDERGYHVYLQWEYYGQKRTIDSMDFDVGFDQLSHSEVRKIACEYWGVEEEDMGTCTISWVSLSVEREGTLYRIDMMWDKAYQTQVLIDWVYYDLYTGEGSVG